MCYCDTVNSLHGKTFCVVFLDARKSFPQEIMKRCHRLKEYSEFIGEIRRRLQSGLKLEDAVEQGIEACIRRGVLSDILSRSKMEVRKMLLTEYDEKAEREYLRKQSREEGVQQGENRVNRLIRLLLEQNRIADIEKSVKNTNYQKELFQEFDIQ